MAKKLINLLIEVQPEPAGIRKLKKISPIVSVSLLIIFVIPYLISLVYLRINIIDYNNVKKQVGTLEKNIAADKSSESLYITTVGILDKIKKILASDTKIISNTLPVIFEIQNRDAVISSSSLDNNGQMDFIVKTSSIDSMEKFVNELIKRENTQNFKDIKASGILRDNEGSYTFNISLKVDKKKETNE